ncbi:ammonium transporter Rh type B [Condylostylus longicornis]|uniref:ammonium transporter Rh type B n=1 Tax=Condylostylus longicornis TaxID=2530218 RepID=UPI00244E4FBB|nr:ammonium transporter Rh type B [Condylostylus longicornis]
MHNSASNNLGIIFLLIVQFVFLLVYWLWVDYDRKLLPVKANITKLTNDDRLSAYGYSQFQDVQAMIFLGFAFLMTFLKKYGYSATGYTLLVAVIVGQLSMILKNCHRLDNGIMRINLGDVIEANIAAAVPLISMGVLLGRTTPIQLAVMAIIETALYVLNEWIQLDIFGICDLGGSITVHAFGAYFGLAASIALRKKSSTKNNEVTAGAVVHDEPSTYISDLFAILGSLILWIYWPSFNSVLASGADRERAAINTFLSLSAASLTTFALSALLSEEKKFDMVHIQNSTLAGGVAVGSVCNLLIGPHGAVLIGITAGVLSVIGYRFISPFLESKIGLQDTCGVNNLHGMPGILSALFSILYAALATQNNYKDSLKVIFPAMGDTSDEPIMFVGGLRRTALQQAGYQAIGILVTVISGAIGGLITGLILKSKLFRNLETKEHDKDQEYWMVPEDMKEE